MSLRVTGKNMDIGDALRSHVEARVDDAVGKYFDGGYNGHVTVEREGTGFRAECLLHLDTGIVFQSSAVAMDAYQCFDQSAERIEKRLRRYKRRLKNHHGQNGSERQAPEDASYVVFQAPDDEKEVEEDFNPVVVAETSTKLKTLTVGMAVLDLDLTDAPLVMFRNAGNGAINVVYRRQDGNIGWIDPELNSDNNGS